MSALAGMSAPAAPQRHSGPEPRSPPVSAPAAPGGSAWACPLAASPVLGSSVCDWRAELWDHVLAADSSTCSS